MPDLSQPQSQTDPDRADTGPGRAPEGPDRERSLTAKVCTIRDVLEDARLAIPAYQRPYRWDARNALQLVEDVERFRSENPYRIGTFIVHDNADRDSLDLVDGQQRYLTSFLVVHALSTFADRDGSPQSDLHALVERASIPKRHDGQTDDRLRVNASALSRLFATWTVDRREKFTDFFLTRCHIVQVTVHELDGAFQMFDSQNTRGRPLFPTDLLKAYHLREMARDEADRSTILRVVRDWEQIEPRQLDHVISKVVYPIRRWTRQESLPTQGLTNQDVDEFKGIRSSALHEPQARWSHPLLMAHAFVEAYRRDNETLIHHRVLPELEFPFQLTQPVLDGEMFFRMVLHYVALTERLGGSVPEPSGEVEDTRAVHPDLAERIGAFDAATRGTGDRYVRHLFDCLLLAYADRFGETELDRASELLAGWALALRLALSRVQLPSVNSYALGQHNLHNRAHGDPHRNLFVEIASARDARGLLNRIVPPRVPDESGSGRFRQFKALLPATEPSATSQTDPEGRADA
ncbi:DUF262 domain-containing protein [Brachybacterium muris]|uniref:DUF262 domain-containing protein n=1 Tax=Brachybacterium muris TaxID=219301 RepID=UPI00223A8F7E|nr:DUF262 domain-containing protein [Brachybacterium muris]MCT1429951.1 DUF262 domain-containing protein [Brachybacterium muris]MCT2177653.1 DUF262 domain-containing protein [Brachybacterium muris]